MHFGIMWYFEIIIDDTAMINCVHKVFNEYPYLDILYQYML